MPLDVIGAGLGRTGTLSLKAALEGLGFAKCYHMVEAVGHPAHFATWNDALRGKSVDWEALFRGYRATVDWPGCHFYREFHRLYPEAKVILTVRDPARWYESVDQTLYRMRRSIPPWVAPFLFRMRPFLRMVDRMVWNGFFDGRFADRAYAIGAFERHVEEVRSTVPADQLLVFDVKHGWDPLCAFLGVPAPEGTPFPHLNDAETFRKNARRPLAGGSAT